MISEQSSLLAAELCGAHSDLAKVLTSMSLSSCHLYFERTLRGVFVTCAIFYNEQVECIYVCDPKVRLLKMHYESFFLWFAR